MLIEKGKQVNKLSLKLLAHPNLVSFSWTVFLLLVAVSLPHPLHNSMSFAVSIPHIPIHNHYSRKGPYFLWQLFRPPVHYKVPLVIAYFYPKTKGYVIKRVYCTIFFLILSELMKKCQKTRKIFSIVNCKLPVNCK